MWVLDDRIRCSADVLGRFVMIVSVEGLTCEVESVMALARIERLLVLIRLSFV